MRIGVVGLWHLGEIYSVCLAELGHQVIGLSDDRETVGALQKHRPPVAEPGLVRLIKKNQKIGRLVYHSDFNALKECDVVWITQDTAIDDKDAADTRSIFDIFKKALPKLRNRVLIIVSSQLPVGTSEKIVQWIKNHRKNFQFSYAYVPENLRLGEAVENFFNPTRIVIGADDPIIFNKVQSVFRKLKTDFLPMRVASAEMAKHALNAFLATSLSFIYDIADVCEKTRADVVEVARALRSDPRIGPGAYLDASIGFSGGTLARDLSFLLEKAKINKIDLPVIHSVLKKNRNRRKMAINRLKPYLGNLRGKKIAILGLAYKAGTNTLRRSLALEIIADLNQLGAELKLCDPNITINQIKTSLPGVNFSFFKDWLQSVKNCQAVLIITPWPELKKVNFLKMKKNMGRQAVLFDARNFFVDMEDKIKNVGLVYLGIGR